jgi:hypothetical protein
MREGHDVPALALAPATSLPVVVVDRVEASRPGVSVLAPLASRWWRDAYSFFFLAPLTFAVPRSVFWRFLRCLPGRG